MQAEQVTLVQKTFEQVAPIADTAADLFYNRLFEIDPPIRALFTGDMKNQGRMVMTMIGLAVNGLSRPASLVPLLRDLGRRHVAYGVVESDYDTVADALLWTLAKGLGERFTSDVREAWTEAYGLIARAMKEGARDAQGAMAIAA